MTFNLDHKIFAVYIAAFIISSKNDEVQLL